MIETVSGRRVVCHNKFDLQPFAIFVHFYERNKLENLRINQNLQVFIHLSSLEIAVGCCAIGAYSETLSKLRK